MPSYRSPLGVGVFPGGDLMSLSFWGIVVFVVIPILAPDLSSVALHLMGHQTHRRPVSTQRSAPPPEFLIQWRPRTCVSNRFCPLGTHTLRTTTSRSALRFRREGRLWMRPCRERSHWSTHTGLTWKVLPEHLLHVTVRKSSTQVNDTALQPRKMSWNILKDLK